MPAGSEIPLKVLGKPKEVTESWHDTPLTVHKKTKGER